MTSTNPKDHIVKFQQLLRELFQFDCAELDFGIYRIMNHKRDVLEQFINENLPNLVDTDLEQGILFQQDQANKALDESRENVIEQLGRDAIDGNGELVEAYQGTPIGKTYLDAKAVAASGRSRSAVEIDIYNHLYAFFSRYYQEGDFISKRRYSRNQRYAIPYNGEEVYLHWANSDQYYIKTAEHFHNYDWKAPNGVTVHFRLKAANVEQDNVKGEKRFFMPLITETKWDANTREVIIPFEYRPLTAQEKNDYGTRNHQQDKIITAAIDAIPEQLGNAHDALAALMAEKSQNSDGEPITFLEHHLRQYTQRNTSDFFIHKDLKGFLYRELDFYLKNEVLNLDEMASANEDRLKGWFQMMQLIKSVGSQIIDFLDQIEGFQKMLWEKRKFITETQYCITVGNIDESFHADIAVCEAQWTEWKALFSIDEDETDLFNSGKNKTDKRIAFLKTHPTLVLDTTHFDRNFIDRLLASFDDLDEMTDGLLIHSENYQALNLLSEKYSEQVKCIYIDPPYNAKSSEIIYKNSYKHACWLSLMENRINTSKYLLKDDFVYVIAIDEVEQEVLGQFLSHSFSGREKTCVTVIHNATGQQGANFSYTNEFAYFIFPKPGTFIGLETRTKPDIRPLRDVSKGAHLRTDAANCFYPIYVKNGKVIGFGDVCSDDFHPNSINIDRIDGTVEVYPIDPSGIERKWVFARNTVESIWDELSAKYDKKRKQWDIVRTKMRFNFNTVWIDKKYSANSYGSRILNQILPHNTFTFPKSIYTVRDCIDAGFKNQNYGIVLDYFAGSGTTGHAIINLNRDDGGQRKFILVEMGEYFDTVLLPRIKKVTFTPEWKDGKPKRMATPEEAERSPRIIKYIRLESYEDALNNIEFDDTTEQLKLRERIDDYLLKYMLKWETKRSHTLLNVEKLTSPFTYRLRIHVNGEIHDQTVDIPETFNYLLGLNVSTRKVYEDDERHYLIYRGKTRETPGQEVAIIWRETEGWTPSDFERDRQFVAEQKLIQDVDVVYVNGDSCILNAKAVEPIFKARMLPE